MYIAGGSSVSITAKPVAAATSCKLYNAATPGTIIQTITQAIQPNKVVTFNSFTISKTATYTVDCDDAPICTTPYLNSVSENADRSQATFNFSNMPTNPPYATLKAAPTGGIGGPNMTSNTGSPNSPRSMTLTSSSVYEYVKEDYQVTTKCSDGTSVSSNIVTGTLTTAPVSSPTCTTQKVDWNGNLFNWNYGEIYSSTKVLTDTCSSSDFAPPGDYSHTYVSGTLSSTATPYSNYNFPDTHYYCKTNSTPGLLNQDYYGPGNSNNWTKYTMTNADGTSAEVSAKIEYIHPLTICL